MTKFFGKIDYYANCAKEPLVKNNPFIGKHKDLRPLPKYKRIEDKLPAPFWDGHGDAIDAYYYAWKLAFSNLRKPHIRSKFVSRYIDTAFNGCLFMWDSSFIVQFGKYASHVFNFQGTLDNFYSCQHKDGFISRELHEKSDGERFEKNDPESTGPNILPWAEWLYFKNTGDVERLKKVFYPLFAFHRWLKLNRTWRDGGYFSCGLACGMDNAPRVQEGYDVRISHGHAVWIDATCQQIISAKILIEISKIIGKEAETEELKYEVENLTKLVNDGLWSEKDGFYYDLWRDKNTNEPYLSGVKTVASYWALLADLVPEVRIPAFVGHLKKTSEFNRPHRVPTLSADDPHYDPEGRYWLGSVWAPTNYMVLNGLAKYGEDDLAYEIACNNLDNVIEVYKKTGTLWENYAPEQITRGNISKPKFVGWTGLIPISVMLEYVYGIRPDAKNNHIVWRINRTERHGVKNYPLQGGFVNLECAARGSADEKPKVTVTADFHLTVEVVWQGKTIETIKI